MNFISINGLGIDKDTQLKPQVYILPEGITIDSDKVTLEGQGATIMSSDKTGQGIKILGRKNVVLKNLHVINYYHGISIQQSVGIEISNCTITQTAEIQSNTLFLDIWKPTDESYGGGIYLKEVTHAKIHDNDLQHQMNGLLSYQCKRLNVTNNLANYCSGFGFHLFDTSDSLFALNCAAYCC